METGLRALAHPERRHMLRLAWGDEHSSGELARRCRLSAPAASQHLKVLKEAGLVSVRVDGNRRLYRARPAAIAQIRQALDEFWGDRLAALKDEVERG